MRRIPNSLIVAALSLVVSSAAWGQVDARVNQGNVLDANPGVGSGGANTAVAPTTALDTQLIVSGQTTGLSGFRGNVPYYQPNQFHGNLPSQMIESFNARAVSLYEAQSGVGLTQSGGYFGRDQTVMGLRGIKAGLNAPGTNRPMESAVSAQTLNEFRSGALQDYQPLMVQRPAGQLLSDNPIQGPMTQIVIRGQAQGVADRFAEAPVDYQPGADALMTMPREKDRQDLMDEFMEMRNDIGATREFAPEMREELGVNRQVDTTTVPTSELMGFRLEQRVGEVRPELVRPAEPDEDIEAMNKGVVVGNDPYFDLVVAIHMRRGAEELSYNPGMVKYVKDYEENLDRAAVVYDKDDGLYVIYTLAGMDATRFNQFMSQGQILMLQERYYLAEMKFSSASLMSPHNPFAPLGSCVAMFAGGEAARAAEDLNMAFTVFPALMETRLDTARIVSLDDFNEQLAAIKTTVDSDSPDPAMLMLAIYMSLADEDDVAAKKYAESLQRIAGDDGIHSSYATFILTGERPSDAAESDE